VRPPSGWGRCEPKPANEVITDSGAAKPAIPVIPDACNPNTQNPSNKGRSKTTSKPANENEVITDSAVVSSPSACEPYREAIDLGISRGRNAMAIWVLCRIRHSRHTYTTLLTQNDEEVKVVQELLRHANSRITLDLYAQAGMPNKRLAQSKLVRMVLNKGKALA
jgi:hypothetical protein